MKTYEEIIVDRVGTDGRVARITINRPEHLNAFTSRTFGELDDALRDLEADSSARVIILRGAGRAFSVGYDLKSTAAKSDPLDSERKFQVRDERERPLTFMHGLHLSKVTAVQMFFFRMAKISIVQAHGYCVAGGMELAMMGDLVTGSEDCIFGHPGHRSIGVARNGMILPMVLGMRKAKELFYTGDGITGKEAERLGLINYAWPEADLEQKTIELADRVANQSADFLAVLKTVANRFYENMGLESSVQTATHFDASIQNTEQAYRFREVMQTSGLKAALQFRDGPYADYSAGQGSKKSNPPTG